MDTTHTSGSSAASSVDEMDHDHAPAAATHAPRTPSQIPGVFFDSKHKALEFLRSLLNKNMRVVTTDGRMFWGGFKCTDPDSNIVLQHTYEYREPSQQKIAEAQVAATARGSTSPVKLEMTSRYLGLVVIPGQYIVKMEVEEFASQMKGRRT